MTPKGPTMTTKQKITSRFTGDTIFERDAPTLLKAVEMAIASRANLSGADLSHADLSHANLSRASLYGADLSHADLSHANLSRASLYGASLYGANLYGANLYGANLYGANLYGANLYGANLSGANLSRASLYGANLSGAEGIDPNRVCALRLLLEQPGKIRAYKMVREDGDSPINSKRINYQIGKTYTEPKASTDLNELCGEGLHVATLDWVMREYQKGFRILVAEFTAKDIAAIPTTTDGKFRVRKLKIVGEKDLVELGLVKKAGAK